VMQMAELTPNVAVDVIETATYTAPPPRFELGTY
jgi:hypothetical protein